MRTPAIVVVSFGTSYGQTRSITIGAIESTIAECFPDHLVRRAFTSNIIRKKLLTRDGIRIDSVGEALEKLAKEGVRDVLLMPTHFMEGEEFNEKIKAEAEAFKGRFDTVKVGHALLTEERDYDQLVSIIDGKTSCYSDGKTARVFMGHGTEHAANSAYKKLQDVIDSKGIKDLFIGTVEATPSVDDILEIVKKGGFERVVLSPLMIVAGDHATNDMAGDDDDSWKNIFKRAGFKVECLVEGLGSCYEIQKMIAAHCKLALEQPC